MPGPRTSSAFSSAPRPWASSSPWLTFGTAGAVTEVATFRKDLGYSDGRHPDGIAFVDAEADAQRRDFTVNGMFLDPQSGAILDFVGGREDPPPPPPPLAARKIRAIGDPHQRFSEDYLRLMRAPRFAAMLRFEIEDATAAAIREKAGTLAEVSGERIAQEIEKALLDRGRGGYVRIMDDVDLLEVILPEVSALEGVPYRCTALPDCDALEHTVRTLERLDGPSFPLVLAALLHETGRTGAGETAADADACEEESARIVGRVASRLRLSNAVRDRTEWLVRQQARFRNVGQMRPGAMRRLFAEDGFAELCAFVHAKALAIGRQPVPIRGMPGAFRKAHGHRP